MIQNSLKQLLIVICTVALTGISCHQGKKTVDDLYYFALSHKNDLRLSAYLTVDAVATLLNTIEGRREAVSVLRSLGITRAYIETYRSGRVADVELLKTIRDYFRENGLESAGGIATTPGENFGVRQEAQLDWFNFQHPETQQGLEQVVRLTAQTFDEVIIDDFLCTGDTSAMSIQARGDNNWSQYRMNLLTDVSERLIINTARKENPDGTVIIKYPQWYDRFHMFGYDVTRQPALYDKVWIGTETRGPATQRMGYVQQYEGFVNFRWLSTFAPNKVGGAWFDHIDCDENDFIDQAYQTVLAGAREIILFSYFDLVRGHPGHHLLRNQFATLIRLAEMVRQKPANGIYGYKPPHSNAIEDFYIYDFIGMIGVPLLPVSQFPAGEKVIFLPTQAAADTMLVQHLENSISNGQSIIMTGGLLKALSNNPRLLELAGVQFQEASLPSTVTNLIMTSSSMVTFEPELELATWLKPTAARVLLYAWQDQSQLPFLTVNELASGGKLYVLNTKTFSEKDFKAINEVLLAPKPITWLNLPIAWLNQIRQCFTEPLGFTLSSPGRVSVHLFGMDNWIICNFNHEPTELDLNFTGPHQTTGESLFVNQLTGDKLATTGNKLHLSVGARQITWLTKRDGTE